MKADQVFDTLINELMEDEKNISISIIGSAALMKKEDFYKLNDIDLFVVRDAKEDFMREVRNLEGVTVDITYISMSDLNKLIVKDNHGWIRILSKAKHIFKRNKVIEGYFVLANKIFMSGPDSLNEKDINFYRFRLSNQFEDIKNRATKEMDAHFLINIFITDILRMYYKLQNTWVPRDKKILSTLFGVDLILYELVKAALFEREITERVRLVEDILIYVLRPYGGIVKELEKCEVPFNSKK